jgi:CheY-like chemotaxis protein
MIEGAVKRVLLLDDEKLLLLLYKTSFEKSGYAVSTFSDADSALAALRSDNDPDVILFDITLPDSKSGYEFIETVQREGLAQRSLKVALTNEGQMGEVTRMKELGAEGHILKAQYIPSELVKVVGEMLEKHTSDTVSR